MTRPGEPVNAGVCKKHARRTEGTTRVGTFTSVHQPTAALFAQANLDPRTLGLQLEHHQAPDGTWQTTLPTTDLVLLLDLALNPKAPA